MDGQTLGAAIAIIKKMSDNAASSAAAAAQEVYDNVQEDMGDLILVQDSQPASADNKIWVKETPQTEVEVPTYTEFTGALNQKYTKPQTGIPKTDLASDVQTSLGKADTALQGQDVTEAVDEYLSENFSNPSNPPLDRTLSSALSAAPADMVGNLFGAINEETGLHRITFTDRCYVKTTGTLITMSEGVPVMETTPNFKCAVISCNEGDTFTISGTGGSSARLWTFADSTGTILFKSASGATESGLLLTAPTNAKWFILHNATADTVGSYTGAVPLSDMRNEIKYVDGKLYDIVLNRSFEHGTINNTYGDESGNPARVRSIEYIPLNELIGITLDESAEFSLKYYNQSKTFISGDHSFRDSSMSGTDVRYVSPAECKYIRVVGRYANDATITKAAEFNDLIAISYRKLKSDILDSAQFERNVINLGLKHGNINYSSGAEEWNTTTRVKSHVYIPIDEIESIALTDAYVSLRYYDSKKAFISGMNNWVSSVTTEITSVPDGSKYIRIVARNSANNDIGDILSFSQNIVVTTKRNKVDDAEKKFIYPESNKIFTGNTGNMSIVCAKEHTNTTGNFPVVEWYLLEEAGGTNRFFISNDLVHKEFAFMFTGDAYKYSFGVLANGDIIAVLDASAITWKDSGDVPRSETFRQNPYVFLASENWSVQHEVSFSTDLKPMGWLSNYGFRVLPDGSSVFAEYTRYCVLTSNVWRVNGDPTDAANWTAVISLNLPEPGLNLLKHWHTVQYDPYGKVVYAATGDSNSGSFCYYSTDYGVTWTQLSVNGVDHSDKYFRFLNLIFTEDTIYWAKDWYDAGHYLFKCERNANGILDIDNVVDWIQIPTVENLSTYTTCYIPEIDAILLLEREDSGGGTNAPAPIRLCDLTDGTLHIIAYMKSAKGVRESIGFRTRYSEVYPVKCTVNVGFALRRQYNANAVNLLKWYDNAGNDTTPYSYGLDNVNNLRLEVYKSASGYNLKVGTILI